MATIIYALVLSALVVLIDAQYNNQQSSYNDQQYQPQQQQYQPQQQYQQQQQYQPNQPQHHAILMHKQALGQDGTFNYAFKSDNGLQQGESISPDGSRVGGYSYVDPDGKTISVKYSAGKDGFKILEGDHVPKAPLPIPAPAAQPAYPQNQYQPNQYQQSQPLKQYQPSQTFGQLHHRAGPKNYNSAADEDDGSYRPGNEAGFKDLGSPYREQLSGFGGGAHFSGKPLYGVHEDHGESRGNLFTPKSVTYPTAPKPAQYNKAPFTPSAKYSPQYSNAQRVQNDGDNGDYAQEKEHSGPHNFGTGYSFEFGG